MSILPPSGQTDKAPLHWPSLLQLVLSLLAALLLLGAALIVAISTATRNLTNVSGAQDPIGSFMVAASLGFAGILVLPSAWYAWKELAFPERATKPAVRRRNYGLILTVVVFILLAGVLLLGNWSAQNNRLTWLLVPLNLLATGLPALWIIYIGTHGLIPDTPRHKWGVFASGLVSGPVIILVLELLLLVFMGILTIFWIMLNPNLANQLYGVVIRLQNAGQDMNAVISQLIPFMLNPGVIFLIFAFISVLIPIIEEALKPIGVWFLSGQKLSPAQGFGYGVLSGAGFGLFENLGYTSGAGTDWALLASTRISTILLHCFTAGLMGWALASAWSERRYLRLGITYAIAVIVHGLWNGLAVLSAAPSLPSISNVTLPAYIQPIGTYSSDGIIVIGVIILVLYLGANTILLRSSPPAAFAPPEIRPVSPAEGDNPSSPEKEEPKTSDGNPTIDLGNNE